MTEAKAAILGVEPRAEVILFGSRARGEAHEESDFDLLIVTPQQVSGARRQAFYGPVYELDLEYGVCLSMHFVSRDRWSARGSYPFLSTVEEEGIAV